MNTEIQLVQVPVITHMLAQIGQNVTERLDSLNIDAQVATPETVKALKELRADLNKELASFEEQRKLVKSGVLTPYNEFEAVYKTEVSDKYGLAIGKLKDKIAQVETQVKDAKKANLIQYFKELCLSENIDFLTFDQLKLDINLSTTEKAYKEQINAFVYKVVDDLELIKTQTHEAEIMVAYKATLNASKAIKDVNDRKEKERLEIERIKIVETNRRIDVVKKMGMTFMDMTNAYEYDAEIFFEAELLKSLSTEDFNTRIIAFKEAINAKIIANTPKAEPVAPSEPVKPPVQAAAPLKAPTVEEKPDLRTASFEVVGTMAQLRALGQYMRDNNIQYKNI